MFKREHIHWWDSWTVVLISRVRGWNWPTGWRPLKGNRTANIKKKPWLQETLSTLYFSPCSFQTLSPLHIDSWPQSITQRSIRRFLRSPAACCASVRPTWPLKSRFIPVIKSLYKSAPIKRRPLSPPPPVCCCRSCMCSGDMDLIGLEKGLDNERREWEVYADVIPTQWREKLLFPLLPQNICFIC